MVRQQGPYLRLQWARKGKISEQISESDWDVKLHPQPAEISENFCFPHFILDQVCNDYVAAACQVELY